MTRFFFFFLRADFTQILELVPLLVQNATAGPYREIFRSRNRILLRQLWILQFYVERCFGDGVSVLLHRHFYVQRQFCGLYVSIYFFLWWGRSVDTVAKQRVRF